MLAAYLQPAFSSSTSQSATLRNESTLASTANNAIGIPGRPTIVSHRQKKDSSPRIALGRQISERFEKEFQAIRIDRCSNEPRYGSCLVCG